MFKGIEVFWHIVLYKRVICLCSMHDLRRSPTAPALELGYQRWQAWPSARILPTT